MRIDRLNACVVLTRTEQRAFRTDAAARSVVIAAAQRAANRWNRVVHVVGPWALGSDAQVTPSGEVRGPSCMRRPSLGGPAVAL
jgi:hypothetical protein